MKTTVVIPNYNGKNYLEDCLPSIRKGTTRPAVIVVDNGSTDGSVAFLKEQFPEVKCIALRENLGFSAAVNIGIENADTEFVFLLNNDTVVSADAVEKLEKAMECEPKAFSMAAKMLNMKEPEKIDSAGDFYCALGWAFARGKDKSSNCYERKDRIFSSCAGAALYRKAVLTKLGGFDEAHFAYLEDIDICYRASLYGFRNYYIPEAVVYHAGSGSSGSRYNEFKVRLSARNSIYLVYKNMPILQILLNLPFLFLGFLIKTLFFVKKGFGRIYLRGLCQGFWMCFAKDGKAHKIKFTFRNIGNYCYIQLQLWVNMFRRFLG